MLPDDALILAKAPDDTPPRETAVQKRLASAIENKSVVTLFEISVWAAAILRRAGGRAADANRIPPEFLGRFPVFDVDFVLPPIAHVIDVGEPKNLTFLRNPKLSSVLSAGSGQNIRRTVANPAYPELKEMQALSPHGHLDHAMKLAQ